MTSTNREIKLRRSKQKLKLKNKNFGSSNLSPLRKFYNTSYLPLISVCVCVCVFVRLKRRQTIEWNLRWLRKWSLWEDYLLLYSCRDNLARLNHFVLSLHFTLSNTVFLNRRNMDTISPGHWTLLKFKM